MAIPSGYTALDFVGFTDRGTYAANVSYVKNDLVHHGGNIWRVLIDGTIGVTPAEGVNYTLWMGEPTNLVERIIAPLEDNPATVAYGVGRQIIFSDWLYEVIAPIAVGDDLVTYETDPTNANIKLAPPVETQVLGIKAEADATDAMIAPNENGSTMSQAYAIGEQFIRGNVLYKAKTAITSGTAWSSLTLNTNYEVQSDSLVEQIQDNSSDIQTLTNNKVNTSDIANNLTTTASGKVLDARQGKVIADNYQNVRISHNIPRLIPKDITSYITDGSFYSRLTGTNGYELFQDIYVGDFIQMSRAITAPNQDSQYAVTGSQYVMIIGLDTKMNDNGVNYHHAVMAPGGGTDYGQAQHFGRKRMYASVPFTSASPSAYKGSEMYTSTLGAVVSAGSTATGATINQQLYAEFGSHLKTTQELITTAMNANGYGRFGTASGVTSNWEWVGCQAVLMSEVEVYGSVVWGSSGYDIGTAKAQFPLFAHSKKAMNNGTAYYWLKDVASGSYFCDCGTGGGAGYYIATRAGLYVRPRFVIGA